MNITDVKVDDNYSYERTVIEFDLQEYARLSGDDNPLHTSEDVGSRSRFQRKPSYGLLTAMWLKLGHFFPNTLCLSQEIDYPNPVYVGDTLHVALRVKSVSVTTNTFCVYGRVSNTKGGTVLRCNAMIMVLNELNKE